MDELSVAARNAHEAAERVTDLRAELASRGLAGFIVPRADEHQGEYVAPRAQRLAWLTGFTGSAGAAVVLADRAAIFIDGRYTIQVRQQVDIKLFEPLHLIECPPDEWLGGQLQKGDRFGFDPWLHTPDGTDRLRRACERVGATLVACETNPLDAVWADQPAAPLAPILPHPVSFSGRSSSAKRAELGEMLEEEGQDATILTTPDSIAWLLNVRGGDVAYSPLPLSFAILHADGAVDWFVDSRKIGPDLADFLEPGVTLHEASAFGVALDRLAGKVVRLDPSLAPSWVAMRLQDAHARLERGSDPCLLPKACKNEVELAGTRAAHRRDGAALTRFLAWLAEQAPGGGLTEIGASDRLEAFRRENEMFRDLSFPTISGAGPDGAIVHYRAMPETDRRIEAGQLYLVDSGAQYLDGTTDVTRTIAIGTPPDDARQAFTLVLKGHIALARVVFPAGTTGSQLDALARRPLWSAGLDYDHGTGHGVGSYLGVHEGPQRISKAASTVPLRPGMIVSNEPGYYKADCFGIRIENLQAVHGIEPPPGAERPLLGFETLTLAPIDLTLVDPDLLDAGERDWLNAYHARVRAEIGPLVDPATRAWMEQATRAV
jgi:Xaa-Pro aminopeptidase